MSICINVLAYDVYTGAAYNVYTALVDNGGTMVPAYTSYTLPRN